MEVPKDQMSVLLENGLFDSAQLLVICALKLQSSVSPLSISTEVRASVKLSPSLKFFLNEHTIRKF